MDTGLADVVISNGVLNLVPEKDAALDEMSRVPRSAAELRSLISPWTQSFPRTLALTSTSGPVESRALCWKRNPSAVSDHGFADVTISDRFDCFCGTTKEKRARRYGVHGVNSRS